MTKDELISKLLVEKAECSREYHEARKLKRLATDPEIKKNHEANQDYYSSRKHAIEDFLRDLEKIECR